ncbi:hypothetical protein HGRIS_010786 [Hohenbuehelia grisea]|uniref:ferric-chelate reductase (NADPH) n=1 Tax=Hohenbuehelia grisea TaxID=104357 RepID=A0ABR3IYL6_9AGAR
MSTPPSLPSHPGTEHPGATLMPTRGTTSAAPTGHTLSPSAPSSSSGHGSSNGHGGGRAVDPNRAFAIKRNLEYPWQLWYCLSIFLFIIAACQFAAFVHAKRKRRRKGSSAAPGLRVGGGGATSSLSAPRAGAATEFKTTRSVSPYPRRHAVSLRRLPVAFVNAYRVIAFRWTINFGGGYTLSFADVALSCAYIIALFTWSFINTTDLEGNKHANRYWSNRTGTLATSQFPLITALGTKNNLISLLTGVTYDKLNYLHRMTSRVVFVLIWVHGAGRIKKGIHGEEWSETWLWTGVLGGVAFAVLCLVSIRPVRAQAYELFFYMHFALVLMFLIGSYYHAAYRHFDPYVIACFIIWGLDRVIRFIRVVIFNHSYFGFKRGSGTLDASTELLSDNLVRVTMRRPPHFHWAAGQTAYLIMPSVSTLPFEAHPFTIASFDGSSFPEHQTGIDTGAVGDVGCQDQEKDQEKGTSEDVLGTSARYWKELVFLINVQEGCTRRLAKVAAKNGTIKVFVEGPYGPSPDLRRFDTVVLVAGGSGVAHTLPVFLDTIERVRHDKSVCSRLVFIWSIRDISHVNWVSDTLYKGLLLAPPGLDIIIRISVTGQIPDVLTWGDDDSMHSTPPETPSSQKTIEPLGLLSMQSIQISNGRPDLKALLRQEAESTDGRMVVSVCGSQSIAGAVREALSFPVSSPGSVLRGGASVTLHVESFGYA